MSEISLIANTGIQFHTLKCRVEKEKLRSKKFVYFEDVDLNRKRFWLEELLLITDLDMYALKSELSDKGFIDNAGKVRKEIDPSNLKLFSEDQPQVFEVGNINQVLKSFENKWIPIPYFKNNSINNDLFGPTDWARLFLRRDDDENVEIVLAIDTTLSSESHHSHSPILDDNPHENKFTLCSNEDLILAYFDSITDCEWVENFIKNLFKFEEGDSQTKHIASFIFLVRFLLSTEKMPGLQLLSDSAGVTDVDLILDVGNSRTCALLFENPNDLRFNLNKVKQLEFIDFTDPFCRYSESFSTRVVFKEADFGDVNNEVNQYKKFQWPSFARVGFEAEKIINKSDVELKLRVESKSFNSSPKRYLWDSYPSNFEWNFHDDDLDIPMSVYKAGISEQLKSNGELCEDDVFGTRAGFSRRSLMTFVYQEIFTQVIRQINSFEFRTSHGNPSSRRRLKRIIISCPTAMVREEQIALRKCAKDAMQLLNNYRSVLEDQSSSNDIFASEVEIIPNLKDLNKNLQNIESKKDWNYDEATVSQIMFLYGSIQHKFDGNPDLFFKLFGDKIEGESKRKSIIGSLDIGAGTSDLMICRYDYKYTDATEISPDPLYWESFSLAGDDLLKNLIQEIIIEGQIRNDEDRDCSGVILNHGEKVGVKDMVLKLNGFFGKDNANMGYKARLMRVSFINQIGIPIAQKYLSIANNSNQKDETLSYEEMFPIVKPSQELLNYFAKHFEFRFEELIWNLSVNKVNDIVSLTFSKLLEQVAKVMYSYQCDLIILSGRPCSLKALQNEFVKNNPVQPNRLINLNNYWVGKWYPFANDAGYIEDPKTVVAVGSLLSLMGGKLFKLDKFRINTKHLREKLVSTADYFGGIKDFTINKSFMKPDEEEASFMIYDIPFNIGFKHIDSKNYPSRYLYSFQFNEENIKKQLGLSLHLDSNKIIDEIENRKNRLRSRLPFKITVLRDYSKDKEKIKIDHIQDKDGDDISKLNFELKLQTLNHTEGYWLDSGEFTLSINEA